MKWLLPVLSLLAISPLVWAGTPIECKTATGVLHGTHEESATPDKSIVLLIHPGSGPTDRDGNSAMLPGKNDSLKLLAEALAAKGIPSVRIDKRGIAGSAAAGAKEEDLRFETYVNDTLAWIDLLQKERGYKQVVLLGHSEGALITMIAAEKKPVAGYISLAGSAKRASTAILAQIKPKLPRPLLGEANVILQQLDQRQTVEKVSPELASLFRPSVQPYLISWFQYNPTEEIVKLTIPILLIQGSTDLQIPAADAEALNDATAEATLLPIEGMNHVLKEVSGDLATQLPSYSDPKLPLHPKLADAIATFVLKTAKK